MIKINGNTVRPAGIKKVVSNGQTVYTTSQYRQIEYTESTNGAYVDLGQNRRVASNTYVRCEFAFTNSLVNQAGIFGSNSGASNNAGYMAVYVSTAQIAVRSGPTRFFSTADIALNQKQITTLNAPDGSNRRSYISANNGSASNNSVTNGYTGGGSSNQYVFAYNNNGLGGNTGNKRIYSYVHRVNNSSGELLVDLVPAQRKSDGVYGFYDRIRNEFLTSADSSKPLSGGAVTNENPSWSPKY